MKRLIKILFLIIIGVPVFAQNVGITDDATFTPSNGLLDIKFKTQTTASNLTCLNLDFTGLSGAGTFTGQKIITPFSYNILLGTSAYVGFFGNHVGIDNGKELRLFNGSYYSSFKAQAQAANIDYSWPTTQAVGKSYLENNGGGILSWRSTPKVMMPMLVNSAVIAYADGQTGYCGPPMIDLVTTESYTQQIMGACNITDLKVNVSANNVTSNTRVILRQNGVSVMLATVTASTTGWFTATGNISIAEGDLIDIQVIIPSVAGARSITFQSITIFYQPQ